MMNVVKKCLLAATLTLLTTVLTATPAFAQKSKDNRAPANRIVAFGDSLSDTGNIFRDLAFPPPPYFEGRSSNGILWLEYLANDMRINPNRIENYAYAGATTGRDNFNYYREGLNVPPGLLLPGLQDQLDQFELDLGDGKADRHALYTVFAGSNDFFVNSDPFVAIATGVTNTAFAVQRLHDAGARRIMVVNLPDLGLTPYGQSGLLGDPGDLSAISAFYNAQLDLALDQLASFEIPTIRMDVSGTLQQIVADPGAFGLVDASTPLLYTGLSPDTPGFLFWDLVHPTTEGHALIGAAAYQELADNHPWILKGKGRANDRR